MSGKPSISRLSRFHKSLTYVVLILLCVPALMPLFWMVSTSLKTDPQIFAADQASQNGLSLASLLPHPASFQNYAKAMHAVPFEVYFKNTVNLVAISVFGAVLSSSIVAHGFAKCALPWRDGLFLLMLATMALPPQVTMVPTFALFRALGWYGTYLPLIVPSFLGVPYFIFLLTQFMKSIPGELYEAGRVDGMSEWQLYTKVTLPLSKPALMTCALFQFVWTWNDFLGPLIYLNHPNQYTVAYGLQQFLSRNGGQWAMLMAASTLFVIPIFIVFVLAQKTFVQGIATTGGKN